MFSFEYKTIIETAKKVNTPESLRAAAELLEAEAKKLDKPLLTKHQEGMITKACEYKLEIINLNSDGTYSFVSKRDASWADEIKGQVQDAKGFVCRILFNNVLFNPQTNTYNKIITIIDEDGEIMTYFQWN